MKLPSNIRYEYKAMEQATLDLIKDKPLLQSYFIFQYTNEFDHHIAIKSLQHYIRIQIRFFNYAAAILKFDFLKFSPENANLNIITSEMINSFILDLPVLEDSVLPFEPGYDDRIPAQLTTSNNYRIAVNSFFSWAQTEGLLQRNPIKGTIKKVTFRARSERIKEDQFLSDEEAQALLELSLTGSTSINGKTTSLTNKEKIYHKKNYLRNNAIICLGLFLGLRVNEIHDLNLTSLNFNKKEITLFRKGAKHSIKSLSPLLFDVLKDYYNSLSEEQLQSPALFTAFYNEEYKRLTTRQIQKIIQKYLDLVSSKGSYSPHKLRHTLATKLLKKGYDLYHVKCFLDHESMDTTTFYLSEDSEIQKDMADNISYEKL